MLNVFEESAPAPIVWPELSAGEAFDAWIDLSRWVTWLVSRFRLRPKEIPPCWYRHGAVVEELAALWGAHRVAYAEHQPATSAADWLRILADTRTHLAEWMARAGCTVMEHRNDPEVAWLDDDPAFRHFVETDCAARNAPPNAPLAPRTPTSS